MSSTSAADQTAVPAQREAASRFHYPLPMPEPSHIPTDVTAQVIAWKESYRFPELSPTVGYVPGTVLAWFLARVSTPETSKAALRGVGCAVEWLLALDDDVFDHAEARNRAGEVIRLVGRITHVLESPGYHVQKNENPYVAAVHDVMEQLRAECTPTQAGRLSAGLRAFLASAVHKLHLDEPDEDEYLALRIHDVGGFLYGVWIDVCGPAPITDEDWNAPAVQALMGCMCLVIGLENDVRSYHKEKAEGQAHLNFVGVLQATRGLSFDQAVAVAVETRDRLMLLFLRLRERLMQSAGTPLQHLIDRLGQVIINGLEMALCAPRYNPSDAHRIALEDVLKTPAYWAPSLTTADTSPLPYPSISWWWDHC
ncbi:terpene synthase family protein [Streptomyces goshikiensis]|uniref:terpene synthase family protein n=1 Tax=Streptomyces goshikiensis TaxID=1942 RepID=UPI0036AA009F